jgi:hypothetical protein
MPAALGGAAEGEPTIRYVLACDFTANPVRAGEPTVRYVLARDPEFAEVRACEPDQMLSRLSLVYPLIES